MTDFSAPLSNINLVFKEEKERVGGKEEGDVMQRTNTVVVMAPASSRRGREWFLQSGNEEGGDSFSATTPRL